MLQINFTKMSELLQILGWAFYLASSWTWCIGMFLPVILLRDYGAWGWVIFVIPNILSACAMPYILRKSSASIEIVEKHKIACVVFSIFTIIFHIYFIGWISALIPNAFILISGIMLFLVYIFWLFTRASCLLVAFIVWILSFVCFILAFNVVPIEKIDLFKCGNLIYNTNALLYLTPVCMFGFLLCPYLDLTFYKARQSNNLTNSKIIFTIGFCILFLLMMSFTFFYAMPIASIFQGIPYVLKDQNQLPQVYIYIIFFHMLIQSGFTLTIHLRSVFNIINKHQKMNLSFLILSLMVYILPIIFNGKNTFLDITINEIIYRSFMAFYSLIAPMYVFLFIIPKKGENISLSKNNLIIWIIVMLFALPFYVIAFLGVKWGLEVWLLTGLAIVLCSKLIVRYKSVTS